MTHLSGRPALLLAVLAVAGLTTVGWQIARHDAPALPDQSWAWQQLSDELGRLDYRTRLVTARDYPLSRRQGLYLVRCQDPRDWDEIINGSPERPGDAEWRGIVVIRKLLPYVQPGYLPPTELEIWPFWFRGDPVEIERIAHHFQLQ
jgi:hypothetical protein